MRAFLMTSAIVGVMCVAGWFSTRASAQTGCTASTISGPYVFAVSGGLYANPTAFAAVGRVVFDGLGSVTGTENAAYGVVGGGATLPQIPFTGTYQVNPDCTGTMTITPASPQGADASHLYFAANLSGSVATFLQMDQATVIVGSAYHQ